MRTASSRDLGATAGLHQRWLATGFFPRLGSRFLHAYHASFAESPAAVALVAESSAGTIGFLVGTIDNEQHYRWVTRRRSVRLAARGLAALLRDRELLAEFVQTRAGRYARSLGRRLRRQPITVAARYEPSGQPPRRPGTVAVLTHVAVAPDARGSGAGRRLVEAFVERVRVAGASEVRLVSPTSSGAPAFYRALGWRSMGTRRASDGSLVEEFRLSL